MPPLNPAAHALTAMEVRYLAAVVNATAGDDGAKRWLRSMNTMADDERDVWVHAAARLVVLGLIHQAPQVPTADGLSWYDLVFRTRTKPAGAKRKR